MPAEPIPGALAPSAFEQLQLELLNRARMNPAGEFDALIANAGTRTGVTQGITDAIRYFNVDLTLFRSQIGTLPAVAPLAWNAVLSGTATAHSQRMIGADTQSHQLPGETGIGTRIPAAGYSNWSRLGENIFAYTADPVQGHAGFFIDWGAGPGGMQTPAGHRVNMLDAGFTEVGIGVLAENNPATSVGPWVVTQDFGSRRGAGVELLGVVIADADGDRFYDIGEGLGGVTVSATAAGGGGRIATTTWASGGYQLDLTPGSWTVTFSGGGLNGIITRDVTIDGQNQKLDALAADARPADALAAAPVDPHLIVGTLAADLLTGGAAAETLVGLAGADLLQGLGGDDRLNGEFVDAAWDPQAAQIYRLYRATLDRAPDEAGHDAWTDSLVAGTQTLAGAAAGFVGSAEFRSLYGSTDTTQFVTLLYQNVLGRAPDPTGFATWTGALNSGTQSRAQVALGFSESREFVAKTEAAALAFSHAGHQAKWSDDVYRLYHATLNRDPDATGLLGWTGRLADGMTPADAAHGLVASAEFQSRYGAASDAQFVTLLYQNVLDRAPDPAGFAVWTGALAQGRAREDVVLGFAQSREFVQSSAADLTAYMRGQQTGPAGGDRLEGGAGNDILFGGIGADTFVFARAEPGRDQVAGLEPWDTIELDGFGYAGAAQALAHLHQSGADAVFADQGVTITFADTAVAALHADMFLI